MNFDVIRFGFKERGFNKRNVKHNNKNKSRICQTGSKTIGGKNESLKQSIKQNGLWAPIAVNQDGVILYGRHRYKICQELGIEPRFEIKDFHDKAQEQMFVIDSNLKRRQPNDYQSIKVALKSKPILEQIAKRNQKAGVKIDTSAKYLTQVGRVNELIAMLAGVSSETVRKVEDIERAATDLPFYNSQILDVPILSSNFDSFNVNFRIV